MRNRVLAASYVKQILSRYKGELRKIATRTTQPRVLNRHTVWFAYEFEQKLPGSRRGADVDDDDDGEEDRAIRVAGRERHVISWMTFRPYR